MPQDVFDRLQKFYSQTFWGNIVVFKCGQAAQALAKRGLNVVRLFIGLSSGGVGQSLYSLHLQCMFGHNFAYFDPNIWFNEDEMRKQVEQLNGCCVLTGQETPGTGRRLREDLYKKFASADGIAGRKPYGFRTRMIHCVGWKRLEANRMFRFADVGKKDFNAIMRRSLVWRVKSRFEDPQAIQGAYEDIHKDGVFVRDPDLADFIKSGSATAAGIQLQHAFEASHSKEQCLEMIENYVVWGGDGGLTEETMRLACGLPPRDVCNASTRTGGVIDLDQEPEQEEHKAAGAWQNALEAIVSFLLERRKQTFTAPLLGTIKVTDGPNVTREGLLEGLLGLNYVKKFSTTYRASFSYMPSPQCKVPLASLVDLTTRTCELELGERYNIAAYQKYLLEHSCRRENVEILSTVLEKIANRKKERAGKPTPQETKTKEDFLTRSRKMQEAERNGDRLLEELQPPDARAGKRRRMTGKAANKDASPKADPGLSDVKEEPGAAASPSSAGIVSCLRSYHYPGPETLRTRKQVSGVGAQSFPRRAQVHLLRETYDLDISNCVFTLLAQLQQRLQLTPSLPEDVQKTLDACVSDRDSVCRDTLKVSVAEGKQTLVSILYGAAPPEKPEDPTFIANVQKLSLYMRWLAVMLLPEEFEAFKSNGKKNPDASTLAHLYMALEDVILTHWCEYVMSQHHPQHLSLHYDGIRVSLGRNMSVTDLCVESEEYIKSKTGFEVHIREKKHLTVLELLKQSTVKSQFASLFEAGDPHLLPGNCIPHALVCLEAVTAENSRAKLAENARPENEYAKQRRCRTYQQCMELLSCRLHPHIFHGKLSLPQGSWILHTENGGLPHCVAMTHLASEDLFAIADAGHQFFVKSVDVARAMEGGVDSNSCVMFLFRPEKDSYLSEADSRDLLDLAAGMPSEVVISSSSSEEQEQDIDDDDNYEEASLMPVERSDKDGISDWVDADGSVTVDAQLLQDLADEVLALIDKAQQGKLRPQASFFSCPACAFRSFQSSRRLLTHLQKYHIEKNQYVASGTKQIMVILAIHDSDMMEQNRQGKYLQRSAALIRKSIKPPLSRTNNKLDRFIRVVLDAQGPRLVHLQALNFLCARRVRNLWYTRKFAERVYQEVLLHNGKARGGTNGYTLAIFLHKSKTINLPLL